MLPYRPVLSADPLPISEEPDWAGRLPWICCGTTQRIPDEGEPNYGLYTPAPSVQVLDHWAGLLRQLGFDRAVHSKQVHGSGVRVYDQAQPGLSIGPPVDGHSTCQVGVLLTVAVADCVPIFIIDPRVRAIALLHGGWRGIAAGIFAVGVTTLVDRFGSRPQDLLVHLGPSISHERYEVGPEVFEALGQSVPSGPTHIDLGAVLRARVLDQGIRPDNVTSSEYCTADPDSPHFSHRGGDSGRQIAFLGINADGEGRPGLA